MLGEKNRAAGDRAARATQVQIGVNPPFDTMFRAIIEKNGGRSGAKNQALGFARRAAGGVLEGAGSLLPEGLGSVVGGVGDLID
jgi:hypothetical protein